MSKYKANNLKRVYLSEAGFLLIKKKEYKNGNIVGYEVSDNGGVEEVEWHKDDRDIKPIKEIRI